MQAQDAWGAGAVTVPGRDRELVFQRCLEPALRERIFELRQAAFGPHGEYLLRSRPPLHPAEDAFDEGSFQFCCRAGGELVAACRFTPPLGGRWEASELAPLPSVLLEDGERRLQISRVVVREDLRGQQVTEVMLLLACRWLAAHTRFEHYFALCAPRLAAFYEHFGAESVPGPEIELASRAGNRYRWIHGHLVDSIDAIAAHLSAHPSASGWRLPHPVGAATKAAR